MTRLTPAQKRGLELLATPGAVARGGTPSRWLVFVGDEQIGSIHSATFAALRDKGLTGFYRVGDLKGDIRQCIVDAGRAYLAARPASDGQGGQG